MKKALIAGSTGLVGQALLREIQDSEIYSEVYLLVRKPMKNLSSLFIPLIVDFDQLAGLNLPSAIDDLYCCLGTTQKTAGSKEAFYRVDHDYVLEFARLGQRYGARGFALISSIGANPSSLSFYLKTKGNTERDIIQLGFGRTVILRPSLLLGERKEYRFAEVMGERVFKVLRPIMAGPLKSQIPVHVSQVAKAMIHYLGKNEAPGVQRIESNAIRGFQESR